ncbi:hypothetical protein SBI_08804 [Streptomyces bingchenggensis BCW-1]|uniref:DUF4352 domain-containing protein n=1 Tax=Streptomyces bingchenggensis (strain BCW-1) TaxID=749414 RepID=D7BY42_STRBB|nr:MULTISPECIES: DUF4352 domain-containing protein [Streptomyces]ADI11922.1 hypothetical protein SBI_08804 [Streptomyces bingchenggensis BCW-1]
MHRSIAAAAAVVALTATLTACGGSDGDGDKAGSTKDTRSSGAVEPGGETSPEAAPSSASSTSGKLGDTLSLEGIVGLGESSPHRADITLKKFVDNAKASVGYFEAADGNRLVTVQFTIVNTGETTYSDSGFAESQVVDTAGKTYQGKAGSPTVGDSMTNMLNLVPGKQITGWVLYEVPKDAKISAVTYQMDAMGTNPERTGRWTL